MGVTGAFIAVKEGMQLLEEHGQVNIKKLVRRLRKDLAGAVETTEQYRFIYEV